MIIYRTDKGILVESDGQRKLLAGADWDEWLNRDDLLQALQRESANAPAADGSEQVLAPVNQQEVWAAGVTYYRSRTARMEESQAAGGGSFYDRVYDAPRPELFMKANGWRVVPSGGKIRIRADSKWNVPEPELALVINSAGRIIGYTVGNDVSSRDIEGENPLYLPQAKMYNGSCALGPGILVSDTMLPPETQIRMEIRRGGSTVFEGSTTLSQIKRTPEELVKYLYMEMSYPKGAVLLTGTGIVPDDSFTLQSGDEVRISIEQIGTLVNTVE